MSTTACQYISVVLRKFLLTDLHQRDSQGRAGGENEEAKERKLQHGSFRFPTFFPLYFFISPHSDP
jgi:hypothetical protein